MNAQETAEALSEQDIEWTLLVDIFARPDSDGGRTGVSAQFTRFMVFLAAKIGFFANFFVGDIKIETSTSTRLDPSYITRFDKHTVAHCMLGRASSPNRVSNGAASLERAVDEHKTKRRKCKRAWEPAA